MNCIYNQSTFAPKAHNRTKPRRHRQDNQRKATANYSEQEETATKKERKDTANYSEQKETAEKKERKETAGDSKQNDFTVNVKMNKHSDKAEISKQYDKASRSRVPIAREVANWLVTGYPLESHALIGSN